MAYTKTTWTDRIVQYPNRYTQTTNGDGTITLTPSVGTVTQAGSTITAAAMNNIETGVYNAYSKIDQFYIDRHDLTTMDIKIKALKNAEANNINYNILTESFSTTNDITMTKGKYDTLNKWIYLDDTSFDSIVITHKTPITTDLNVTSIVVNASYSGTLVFQVCNNALDASPTWETITALDTLYTFTNATKTNASWALGFKITVTGTRPIYLYGFGIDFK